MMEIGVPANAVLDHALFEVTPSKNRYEALACSHGKFQKLASGPLDQLAIHLPEAQRFLPKKPSGCFQLALDGSLQSISWFTKSTLSRFLHIVNALDVLKGVNAIENEISQLEETKRFQLKLYAMEGGGHFGSETDTQHFGGEGTPSSDATKNELLRAMDLRLSVLNEDLVTTFNQAVGSTCSTKEISDLAAFCQHFGATNLRNFCMKVLSLLPKDQTSDNTQLQSRPSDDLSLITEDSLQDFSKVSSRANGLNPAGNNLSPVKLADAERQSTTESGESSDSSDEDPPIAERSRPLVRSASPRRSASPMRRIQIGRSGSRRSTPLSIKSLNYFPSRDRTIVNRDTDGNNSGDEESDKPSKKPESTVRRMSVQDAISLFESKQKAQNTDTLKQRAAETSSTTNKSVLRRWSAGMSDSFNQSAQESTSATESDNPSGSVPKPEDLAKVNDESDNFRESPKPLESTQDGTSLEQAGGISPLVNDLPNKDVPNAEEARDRAAVSAEWTRQKEAELNEILTTMMKSKHGKLRAAAAVCDRHEAVSIEQREDFNSQYKEKREEKLQPENARKQSVKVAQVRGMQKTFGRNKNEVSLKKGGSEGKHDLSSPKSRRNSSSPILPKKEVSKSISSRKASPKSSTLLTTRSSLPTGALTKSTAALQNKAASFSSSTTRKTQPNPSPTRPSPRTEKPLQQPQVKKATVADAKPIMGSQDTKQLQRLSKNTKDKGLPDSQDGSSEKSAKPSFYNKVTKKSSIVPLEPKPFLKKGTRTGPSMGSVVAKPKVHQLDETPKNGEDVTQEKNETSKVIAESIGNKAGDDLAQSTKIADASIESQPVDDISLMNSESRESPHQSIMVLDASELPVENPSSDHQQDVLADANLDITSDAWMEAQREEFPALSENCTSEIAASPGPAPIHSSSPHIRHSLSQMLQADTCEPEIIEWGNAENPPAFFYQKDSPKGLKRLLKFGRKSKYENAATGISSPSVFSEGEDDQEESKATSKRSSDTFLKKAIQSKSYSQQNISLTESFDGGNSSRRSKYNILSAHSSANGCPDSGNARSRGQTTDAITSAKGTRSFFSLSTFRSSKNETKRR